MPKGNRAGTDRDGRRTPLLRYLAIVGVYLVGLVVLIFSTFLPKMIE